MYIANLKKFFLHFPAVFTVVMEIVALNWTTHLYVHTFACALADLLHYHLTVFYVYIFVK